MIDNFELIKNMLLFEEPTHFYFLQLLKRKKDNPGMKSESSVIDNFWIYKPEDLDKLRDKIINLCQVNNARACIRLNVRDSKKIALQTLKIITDCILNEDYHSVKSTYTSACGQFSSDKHKKWIIDIDEKEIVDDVTDFLVENGIFIYNTIPTKNGFHILVGPFNPNIFTKKYPTISLHKDNPTILYIP